jgi:hypothetical protein
MTSASQQVQASAMDLSQLAEQLKSMVGRFKLDEGDAAKRESASGAVSGSGGGTARFSIRRGGAGTRGQSMLAGGQPLS